MLQWLNCVSACCGEGRQSSDCLRVEVAEEITCRELVEEIVQECGWCGAWGLVERWNNCGIAILRETVFTPSTWCAERRVGDGERVAGDGERVGAGELLQSVPQTQGRL